MTTDADSKLVFPAFLRRIILAGTALTGAVAAVGFAALLLTALFGGEGESAVALAVTAGGVALILAHAVALGSLLLRRRQPLLLVRIVFFGGLGLLAVSGAAVVGAELDDSPGGMLAGLLFAAQGAAAVLTVAFPQLASPRPLRA